MVAPDDYVLLMHLDCRIESGLPPDQFRALFMLCSKCQTCLPRRNVTYHNCDKAFDMHRRVFTQDGDRELLLHGYGGLPVDRFEAVFVHCTSCDKFMTRNVSCGHNCRLMWELFGDE